LGFLDRLRNPEDLPAWRKVVLLCCAGVWMFFGIRQFSLKADIYASAPNGPVIQTKQVYPVHVNGYRLRHQGASRRVGILKPHYRAYHRGDSTDDVVVDRRLSEPSFVLNPLSVEAKAMSLSLTPRWFPKPLWRRCQNPLILQCQNGGFCAFQKDLILECQTESFR